MEELIDTFTLERVHRSGSRFDPEKAKWFNHHYLRQKSNTQLALEFRDIVRTYGFHHDIIQLETLVGLVKERVNFVTEIWQETDFFFKAPEVYDYEVVSKRWKPETPQQMEELKIVLQDTDEFSPAIIEAAVKEWISQKGYNTGAVMNALRLIIVGASRGPHIFDIISWIGKEGTISRIDKGLAVLGKNEQ
jgi:glutamyl-tRNA synthetase